MASLVDLEGMRCGPHGALISVSKPSGAYAKCGAPNGCKTAELKAWAASLNGHLPKKDGDANGPGALSGNKHTATPAALGERSGRSKKDDAPEGESEASEEAKTDRGEKRYQQNGRLAKPVQVPARREPEDFLRRVPPQNLEAEQSVLGAILIENELIAKIGWFSAEMFYREIHREIYKAMLELRANGKPIDAVTLPHVLKRMGALEAIGGEGYLAELAAVVPSPGSIEHYAAMVRDTSIKREIATKATALAALAYNGVSVDGLIGEMERTLRLPMPVESEIVWEGFEAAQAANEEYLKRTPVIDKLCYSSAVSLITGGKHAGKSTLARWMAICVAKGWPVLGRDVTQGPVFYIASEDETMAARQELIRLGWTQADPLRFYPAQNVDDPDRFLGRLTEEIKRYGVRFVVLDMLFDFVRIADEMSYAGTREALGKIQNVASQSGAHIVPIHHAPKNAMIGDAAVAALGSQGLAARVSPIILVRRFGPGVHSISSTSVRDPRGEALIESRLIRNEDGSVTLGGAFKNYMLAEVYTERVIEILESEEGAEYTAGDMATALDISYQVASKCLSLLYKQGLAGRDGTGKKGKPFRYSKMLTEISHVDRRVPD